MRGRKNERKFLRGERVPRADQTLQCGSQQIVMRQNVTDSKTVRKGIPNPTQCVFRRASKHYGQFSEFALHIKI